MTSNTSTSEVAGGTTHGAVGGEGKSILRQRRVVLEDHAGVLVLLSQDVLRTGAV